jgi:putative membrane protein
MPEAGSRKADGVERAAVGVLAAFGAVALAGYATFGLHPELLVRLGRSGAFYGSAFTVFARGQVLLAGLVLGLVLARRAGVRWVPALLALYGLSLGSELAGTTWGIPFGAYGYTSLLGVAWLDRVPALIPLSWFCMAVPSYALARVRFPRPAERAGRVLLGSFILLAWDLSLDPAMSHATRYWWWGDAGPYYGMPLMNLVGWYVTGMALMVALSFLRADAWIARVPVPLLAAYYGANLLLPLGMSAAAGLWGAVVLSLVVLGGVYAAVRVPTPARRTVRAARSVEAEG